MRSTSLTNALLAVIAAALVAATILLGAIALRGGPAQAQGEQKIITQQLIIRSGPSGSQIQMRCPTAGEPYVAFYDRQNRNRMQFQLKGDEPAVIFYDKQGHVTSMIPSSGNP